MNESDRKNIAFIDGQNLYMGTAKREVDPWRIDLQRFRVYLEQKYHVVKAYYFLGYVQEIHQDLYEEIQQARFVLIFREHNPTMMGKKKGNVDSDIIFHTMKKLYKKEDFTKIVLVSGDGDYKLLVDFLIVSQRSSKQSKTKPGSLDAFRALKNKCECPRRQIFSSTKTLAKRALMLSLAGPCENNRPNFLAVSSSTSR